MRTGVHPSVIIVMVLVFLLMFMIPFAVYRHTHKTTAPDKDALRAAMLRLGATEEYVRAKLA